MSLGRSAVRYCFVVLAGFCIDFGLSLALFQYAALPLQLCAAIGFSVALAFNYFLFEHWVFRHHNSAISVLRLSGTSLAATAALATRLGVITLFGLILGKTFINAVAAVISGAAASFIVNYLLLEKVFYRSRLL